MTKSNNSSLIRVKPEELAEELIQAHRTLLLQKKGVEPSPSYFVVAKLVSHMSQENWEKICTECLPDGWCALELSANSAFAHMANLTTAKKLHSPELIGQMLLAAPFLQQLEHEVLRTRRSPSSLALVQFSIADNCPCPLEKAIHIMYEAIQKHGAVCDALGILDPQHAALILPGASTFKAQNLVESILHDCMQQQLSLHAGIAVLTSGDCQRQKLLDNAAIALQNALQENVPMRMYIKSNTSLNETRTLVQSHEKRFLFGGGDEV